MGSHQSSGLEPMDAATIEKAFLYPAGLELHAGRMDRYAPDALSKQSLFGSKDDADMKAVQTMLQNGFDSLAADRAVKDLLDKEHWTKPGYNKFHLQPGQWTDDTSMSLCLAESLLSKGQLDPYDLRLRFLNWWNFGYCNAFGLDKERVKGTYGGCHSVGLGGNIASSFEEFMQKRTAYTMAGDIRTSGNGSLMRLAPAPLFHCEDVKTAMDVSYRQSKTTHQGEEAAECCRLLAYIIVHAIHRPKGSDPKSILEVAGFESPLYSVTCLASSKAEERHEENKGLDLEDRNWNWKDPDFKWAPGRSKSQPGYIGSYAMDCLSMALHCVWTTSSFKEATLKCANLRGDADTVTDVVAQMCGALYGASSIPPTWIQAVQKWDGGGRIALTGYRLFKASQERKAGKATGAEHTDDTMDKNE